MSKIGILPPDGTRIYSGYGFTTNKNAVNEIQNQINNANLNEKADKLGWGVEATLSKDIINVNLNKNQDFSFKSSAEIGGGISIYNKEIKTGFNQETQENIYTSFNKTAGSIKTGITAGVQKDFNFGSMRIDGLGGYDLLQKGVYTGGRLSYANNVNGFGLYGQIDKNMNSSYKEPKFQVGFIYSF